MCNFAEEERAQKDPRYNLNKVNKATLGILDELQSTYKEPVRNTSQRILSSAGQQLIPSTLESDQCQISPETSAE